jgi:hypothetical protein
MSEEPLRHSHFPLVSGKSGCGGIYGDGSGTQAQEWTQQHERPGPVEFLGGDLQQTRGLVSGVEGATSEQVQETVNDAIESASGAGERASDWSNENLDGVRQAVRMQPLALVRSL